MRTRCAGGKVMDGLESLDCDTRVGGVLVLKIY